MTPNLLVILAEEWEDIFRVVSVTTHAWSQCNVMDYTSILTWTQNAKEIQFSIGMEALWILFDDLFKSLGLNQSKKVKFKVTKDKKT